MLNISIELSALLILATVFVLLLCVSILSGRSSKKNKIKPLITNICANCKAGEKSYRLDNHSESCPYIIYCQNGKCEYYKPIK